MQPLTEMKDFVPTDFANAFTDSEYPDLPFSFAFQPIVLAASRRPVGFEALIRGISGENAESIIGRIQPHNRFDFDQSSRMRAIEVASLRGIGPRLHLNCTEANRTNLADLLRATARCADRHGFPRERIVLEFRHLDPFGAPKEMVQARRQCETAGFQVAADNFGAGEVGLKRLVVFRPDYVKLDRALIGGVHASERRRAIVTGLIATCNSLGIQTIACGVETGADYEFLVGAGIELLQGYYCGRPDAGPAPEGREIAGLRDHSPQPARLRLIRNTEAAS